MLWDSLDSDFISVILSWKKRISRHVRLEWPYSVTLRIRLLSKCETITKRSRDWIKLGALTRSHNVRLGMRSFSFFSRSPGFVPAGTGIWPRKITRVQPPPCPISNVIIILIPEFSKVSVWCHTSHTGQCKNTHSTVCKNNILNFWDQKTEQLRTRYVFEII